MANSACAAIFLWITTMVCSAQHHRYEGVLQDRVGSPTLPSAVHSKAGHVKEASLLTASSGHSAWQPIYIDDSRDLRIDTRVSAVKGEGYRSSQDHHDHYRQYVTGLSITLKGHSFVAEMADPFGQGAEGCSIDQFPCLADGSIHFTVDGEANYDLLSPADEENDIGGILVSLANVPEVCQSQREKEDDGLFARADTAGLGSRRHLRGESFAHWLLRSTSMRNPSSCAIFIEQQGLSTVQSAHAVMRIRVPAMIIRVDIDVDHGNVVHGLLSGKDSQDYKEHITFWKMNVSLQGNMLADTEIFRILGAGKPQDIS